MSHHRRLHLSPGQRAELEKMVRVGSAPARTQTRARILLLTDRDGPSHFTDTVISQSLMCSRGTIMTARNRFLDEGLKAALYDRPRPGAKPKITGEVEAQLVMLACSAPPSGRSRWTLQLLADRLVSLGLVESISDVGVYKRLKKTGLSLGK